MRIEKGWLNEDRWVFELYDRYNKELFYKYVLTFAINIPPIGGFWIIIIYRNTE